LSVKVEFAFSTPAECQELALQLAETPPGSPETDRATVPENEPPVATVTSRVVDFPRFTTTAAAAVFRVSVGGGKTVSATEAVAVSPALVPVSTIFETPAATEAPTLTVTVTLVPGRALAGDTLKETPANPAALIVTESLNPPVAPTATVKLDFLPGATLMEATEGVSEKPFTGASAEGHALASTAPSTEPSPVARL